MPRSMINLKDLPGFESAEAPVRNRLFVSVDGLTGKGKTHFSLTAPAPIVLFDLNIRTEGVLHKFTDDKEIYVCKFRIPDIESQDAAIMKLAAIKEWDKFKSSYRKAIISGARTIIIDTGTEAWELIRMARFGRSDVKPFHYGPVNAEFKGLLSKALECEQDVNVIITHKKKSVYVNDQRTGEYERAGFSDIGYMVQVAVSIDYDEDEGGAVCEIDKCGLDVTMEGFRLVGDLCTFPGLARLLLPGGDWK